MKEAFLQIQHGTHDSLIADEDDNTLRNFKHNQIVNVKIKGVQKERSLNQLKLWWAISTYCSGYMGEEMLNTRRKMSDYVLLKTNHVEFSLMVNGATNFKPVSISYDNMTHVEACGAFEDGLNYMCITMMLTTVDLVINELIRLGKWRGEYKQLIERKDK